MILTRFAFFLESAIAAFFVNCLLNIFRANIPGSGSFWDMDLQHQSAYPRGQNARNSPLAKTVRASTGLKPIFYLLPYNTPWGIWNNTCFKILFFCFIVYTNSYLSIYFFFVVCINKVILIWCWHDYELNRISGTFYPKEWRWLHCQQSACLQVRTKGLPLREVHIVKPIPTLWKCWAHFKNHCNLRM